MPDDPRPEFASPAARNQSRPFPRQAYVLGWLAICLVTAEGVNSLVSGVFGTGIILICLVPFMIWLMHIRPRRLAARNRRN
ncbi:MAG TPA: hypothetical protein VFH54_02585 [Mycobacteriales bacterium]|nr:hypothetical protein [Mycobacteriales bacterium]